MRLENACQSGLEVENKQPKAGAQQIGLGMSAPEAVDSAAESGGAFAHTVRIAFKSSDLLITRRGGLPSPPKAGRCADFPQQTSIGGGKIVLIQFRPRNPLERRAIQCPRLAGNQFADVEFQVDVFFAVSVQNFLKQFADFDFDAEFLAQFADEAMLGGFAGLTFAAGKFPKSA